MTGLTEAQREALELLSDDEWHRVDGDFRAVTAYALKRHGLVEQQAVREVFHITPTGREALSVSAGLKEEAN